MSPARRAVTFFIQPVFCVTGLGVIITWITLLAQGKDSSLFAYIGYGCVGINILLEVIIESFLQRAEIKREVARYDFDESKFVNQNEFTGIAFETIFLAKIKDFDYREILLQDETGEERTPIIFRADGIVIDNDILSYDEVEFSLFYAKEAYRVYICLIISIEIACISMRLTGEVCCAIRRFGLHMDGQRDYEYILSHKKDAIGQIYRYEKIKKYKKDF